MDSTNKKPGTLFCTRCYSLYYKTQAPVVRPGDILKCNTCSQLLLQPDLCWKRHQCLGGPPHLDMDLCDACFPEAFTRVKTCDDTIDESDIAAELAEYTTMLEQPLQGCTNEFELTIEDEDSPPRGYADYNENLSGLEPSLNFEPEASPKGSAALSEP